MFMLSLTETIAFIIDYWWLLLLIGILLIIAIVGIIKWGFKALFRLLWRLIKYLIIGIGYIIASPVLLVIGIVKLVRFINGTEEPKQKKKGGKRE